MRRRLTVDRECLPARVGRPAVAALAKKAVKKPKARAGRTAVAPAAKPRGGDGRPVAKTAPPPKRRPDTVAAVGDFERALEFIHRQDWRPAAERLRDIARKYPNELELLDRVHAYLRVAERGLSAASFEPRSADEHYQAGVVRLNAGALDDAVVHLEKAVALDAGSDKAHYALAAALAQREDRRVALRHLRRAIEINSENRIYAANDSDLELLRDEPEFADMVGRVRRRPRASKVVDDESE